MEVENNVCLRERERERERERFTDSFRWKCKKASHLLMYYDVLIKMNYDVDVYIILFNERFNLCNRNSPLFLPFKIRKFY